MSGLRIKGLFSSHFNLQTRIVEDESISFWCTASSWIQEGFNKALSLPVGTKLFAETTDVDSPTEFFGRSHLAIHVT